MAQFWPKLTKIDRNGLFLQIGKKNSKFGDPIFGHFCLSDFHSIWTENELFRKVRGHKQIEDFSLWPHFYRNGNFLKIGAKMSKFGGLILVIFASQILIQFELKTNFFVRSAVTNKSKIFQHGPILTEMDISWKLVQKCPNLVAPIWSFLPLRF